MQLKQLSNEFSVCKIEDISKIDLEQEWLFLSKTEDEISVVCESVFLPEGVTDVEHGWKALKIEGQLDFSLIGILAKISTLLADHEISVFVISTFNTDYILVKQDKIEGAVEVLSIAGYEIIK